MAYIQKGNRGGIVLVYMTVSDTTTTEQARKEYRGGVGAKPAERNCRPMQTNAECIFIFTFNLRKNVRPGYLMS